MIDAIFNMDAVVKSPEKASRPIKVNLHPRVILRIRKHYGKLSENKLRAVGVLLGSSSDGIVNVANCYAVPFEETDMGPSAWFLDGEHVKKTFESFNRINAEKIVGWYNTAPALQESDLDIHRLFHNCVPYPILVLVRSTEPDVAVEAYYVDKVKRHAKKKATQQGFVKVASFTSTLAEADDTAHELYATIKTPSEVILKGFLFKNLRDLDLHLHEITRKHYAAKVGKSPKISLMPIQKVMVSPLVVKSMINQCMRLKKTHRRVIRVLLGSSSEGTVYVSNSCAVPFCAWSPDYEYVTKMLSMLQKINAEEQLVGWYRTGPKLLDNNDLDMHELCHVYEPNPVLVFSDLQSTVPGIPTEAYCDVENARRHGHHLFVKVPLEAAVNEDAIGKLRKIVESLDAVIRQAYSTNPGILSKLLDLRRDHGSLLIALAANYEEEAANEDAVEGSRF